jgi:hypothetical protein
VNRTWTLPAAHGSTLEMIFPFLTYKGTQASAVLYDYFEGHFDVSTGSSRPPHRSGLCL